MNNLTNKINQLKQYPLSDAEIQKVSGHKLIIYPELYNYDSLEHLLHMNDGSVIIMCMQSNNYGHYCCLNKIADNEVQFHDPYGLYPDKQFKFSDYDVNRKMKQNHTYLSWLLYKSPYKLSYNHHKFQQKAKPVQTCGWHCIHRIRNKNLSLEQYKKLMNDEVNKIKKLGIKDANYDDYVCVSLYDDVFK